MGCNQTKEIERKDKQKPLVVRFIVVNDVYQIDNFANYATAKQQESVGADITIGTLAGDFLSPSLLSSMDKGFGMVSCMSEAGIDYVCFGNHEADVKLQELQQRIKESKFVWINSNMPNFPLLPDMEPLPKYKIIEIKSDTQTRKIALIGLITQDPQVYKHDRFGNCIIEPLNPTAARLYGDLKSKEKVDAVIPLTHQLMDEDRELAKMKLGFPLILGGHDHDMFHEVVDGCTILKVGMDAETIGIVDVVWSSSSVTTPTVTVVQKPATAYTPDPNLEKLIKKHKYVLDQLEKAELFGLPPSNTLSTKGVREHPATMATFLLTLVREILGADCTLIGGGGIRGNADYFDRPHFTYADLKAEFPFGTNLIVLPLPGSVIVETIQYSRAGALKSPPVSDPMFMQTDDGIQWYAPGNAVTAIAKAPMDPNKTYNCVMNYSTVFEGLDSIKPIVTYAQEQRKAGNPAFTKDAESTIELKQLLVQHFAKLLLFNMLSPDKVLMMDKDHDGFITKEEFTVAAKLLHGEDVSDLLVNNLFNIADADKNGKIDKKEIEELLKLAQKTYVEVSPIGEVVNFVSGFLTSLSGSIDSAEIGATMKKTFSFDGFIIDDAKKVEI